MGIHPAGFFVYRPAAGAGWADKNRQESRADRVALSCPLATESVRNKTQRSAWHFPHGFGGEGRGEGAEPERTSRNELPPKIRRLETLSRRVFISRRRRLLPTRGLFVVGMSWLESASYGRDYLSPASLPGRNPRLSGYQGASPP